MPYRRGYRPRRYRRRRRYGRGRRNHYAVSKWNPNVSLLPDKLFTKMRYADSFTIISPGLGQTVYSGNQISDPNVSSGGPGTVPRGYFQLAAIYTRYHVTSCKITVRANDPLQGYRFCVFPANTSSTPANFDEAVMRGRSKSRIGAGDEVAVLSNWCSTKAAVGERYTHSQTGITHLPGGTVNPVPNQWLWNITYENFTSSAPATTFQIIIDYNVMWFSRSNILGTVAGGSSS